MTSARRVLALLLVCGSVCSTALGQSDGKVAAAVKTLEGAPAPAQARKALSELAALGPAAAPAVPAVAPYLGKHFEATLALQKIGEPAKPVLLDAAKSPDAKVREAAATALGGCGPSVVPVLQGLLADKGEYVRSGAVRGLAVIAPVQRDAVALVGAALQDAHAAVRDAAVQALGGWADEHADAAKFLAAALADDRTRSAALSPAAEHADAVAAHVTPLLQHAAPKARSAACTILSRSRAYGAKSIAAVQALAHRDPDAEVRAIARRSAEGIRSAARPVPGATYTPEQLANAEHVVRSLAEEVLDAKLDVEARRRACGEINAFGVAARVAAPAMVKALKDGEPLVRIGAADVLERLGAEAGDDAFSALKATLGDADPQVVEAAQRALAVVRKGDAGVAASAMQQESAATRIRALGNLDASGEALIRKAALEDKDPAVRAAAVRRLAQLCRAIEVVLAARADPNREVRSAAGWSVARRSDPAEATRFAAPLLESLEHKDPVVRREAAFIVGEEAADLRQLRDLLVTARFRTAATALLEALKTVPEHEIEKVARCLWNLRPESEQPMLAAAKDPSAELRVRLAKVAGDGEFGTKLRALLLGDADPSVRVAAAFALFSARDVGIPALLAALGDPRPLARKAAAEKLRDLSFRPQSRGPELKPVADVFIAALKDPEWEVRHGAAAVLGELRIVETAPALIAAASDASPQVRTAVAQALRPIALVNAPAFDALVRMTKDHEPSVRISAGHWLARDSRRHATGTQITKIVATLIPLLDDADERVRYETIVSLGALGPDAKAAVPRLRKAVAEVPANSGMHTACRNALKVIDVDDPADRIVREVEAAVAARATPADKIAALRKLVSPTVPVRKAMPVFLKAADAPNIVSAVVTLMDQTLGSVGHPRYASFDPGPLTEQVAKGQPAQRKAALEKLAAAGQAARSAAPVVVPACRDSDPTVSNAALTAVKQIWGGQYLAEE